MPRLSPWRFSVAVLFPMVAITGLACLALVAVLYKSVHEADTFAEARQAGLVRQAIGFQIAQVPHDQESVAIWDDAVLKTVEGDDLWIHENLGEWMFDYFAHDRTYVLDPAGRLIYAMRERETTNAEPEPGLLRQLRALAAGLHDAEAADRHEAEHDSAAEQDTGREAVMHANAPHASHLMSIEGRPAVVSAMVIIPHSDRLTVEPGEEFVHISVQFVDGAFLQAIATRMMLEDAQFAATAPTDGRSGVEITDSNGEPIGLLAWKPHRPGSQILASVFPAGVFVGLVLILAGTTLMRRLYGASVELETSRTQARHLAFHDHLTGLPNRHLLNDRVDAMVAEASRTGRQTALLLFDLDRFKDINDTYGHQAGDELICEFGSRLAAITGEADTLARLGGDEFALLACAVSGDDQLEALCIKALTVVSVPFTVAGGKAIVTLSIGAVAVDGSVDRHELMRRADIALYAAKRAGRDAYRLFAPDMDQHLRERHRIEQELRRALDTGVGLDVHYQPKIATASGRVIGVEALARWQHAELGPIPPAVFIPIAEECGIIGRLDAWVLRRAAETARQWRDVDLAVNISAEAFREAGVAQGIFDILAATGFPPHRLEIEITESVVVELSEQTANELRALRAAGVRIALDDFGTGYSSLNHLTRLHVDRIKVDKSFVQHLGQSADSTAIVSAVVRLGHTIGVLVTAEGVETAGQRDFLRSIGCDEMQGFLFAPPIPADEVAGLLEESESQAVA